MNGIATFTWQQDTANILLYNKIIYTLFQLTKERLIFGKLNNSKNSTLLPQEKKSFPPLVIPLSPRAKEHLRNPHF